MFGESALDELAFITRAPLPPPASPPGAKPVSEEGGHQGQTHCHASPPVTGSNTVNTVTQPQQTRPPTLRIRTAVGLGVASIVVSFLLLATDGITGSSSWAHHPGISAAPLLLIAAAIAARSLAQAPRQRRRLVPIIAALAFTAWGLAQLLPGSTAAGYLSDAAILLFVTDAAYAIASSARNAPPATQPPSYATPEAANPLHTPQSRTRP